MHDSKEYGAVGLCEAPAQTFAIVPPSASAKDGFSPKKWHYLSVLRTLLSGQFSKAVLEVRVSGLGMVKFANKVQPRKALAPITVAELGMVTFANELQPRNA